MNLRCFVVLIVIFVLASFIVPNASAHGDEPRLEISVDRVNPGGVVDVRGVDFEPEEAVDLSLIGSGFELPLGDLVADPEGIFLHIVVLPPDLAEGAYQFRALTDDHEILSPALTVFGTAILSEGGEPVRDEEDGLLAPMPTSAPGVSSTALPQQTSLETTASEPNSAPLRYLVLFGLGILSLIGFRVLKKR